MVGSASVRFASRLHQQATSFPPLPLGALDPVRESGWVGFGRSWKGRSRQARGSAMFHTP
eukprot:285106-Pyramimonas_sp.AAC.1